MVDSKTAVPRLPTEVLAIIAGEIGDAKTLLALSSVSHAWNQLAQPRLYYRSVVLKNIFNVPPHFRLRSKTLGETPKLRSFIRELKLIRYPSYSGIPSFASPCPNLRRLFLQSCTEMREQDLLGIVDKCTSLKELSIAGCRKITSNGLVKILPFLENLRKLNVTGVSNVDNDCLHDIAKMCPLLEDLDLGTTSVTRTGVSSFMQLATNLTSLNLSKHVGINDSEMEAIMMKKPLHVNITSYDHLDIYYDDDNIDSDMDLDDFDVDEIDEYHFSDYDYSDGENEGSWYDSDDHL